VGHEFEAVRWSTIGAATAPDVEILTWANEHHFVIITNDLDFSAILAAGAGTSTASTAFWTVEDVVKEVADLKARGVVFEEYDMPNLKTVNSIATGGGARTAWFKDSEGNILAVSQRV
jgi:predicted nuclease of predicted toxin-antitoxin system